MTPEQIQAVQSSWQKVAPIADQAAAMFYGRLFELDPELRKLFKGDLATQGGKLMTMINLVVNSLDRLDAIVPMAKASGQRHVGYGVKAEDYATVGEALLWTLEQGLGAAFTPAVREAWTTAYTVLAQTMLAGAEETA